VKTALITGAAGQDGTLLAQHLTGRGYQVIGVVRSGSAGCRWTHGAVQWVEADICEPPIIGGLLSKWRPSEIYHLAALHHSAEDSSHHSELPSRQAMLDTNFGSTKSLAFAVLESKVHCHLVFAASSQMFTAAHSRHVIDEASPRYPSTFYGHTKSWCTDLLAYLRNDARLCASTAILFNHESPLRKPQFVSRKITQAAAAARSGRPIPLDLLNIGSRVDWSGARDVVRAMHLMALSAEPRDYVVATGQLQSVRHLLETAFGHVGLDWRDFTTFRVDQEEPALCGQPRLLEMKLGWKRMHSFADVITEMVDRDVAIAKSA
jgi:GDPmannose 4,6-dehydratase